MTNRDYVVYIDRNLSEGFYEILENKRYFVEIIDRNIDDDCYNRIDFTTTYTISGAKRWARRAIKKDKKDLIEQEKQIGKHFSVQYTEDQLFNKISATREGSPEMTKTTEQILDRLNSYTGNNIWQDVIYDICTAEEWDASGDGANDEFVHDGVTYRYEGSFNQWVEL